MKMRRWRFDFRQTGPTWTTVEGLLSVLDEWKAARERLGGNDKAVTAWALDRWPAWGDRYRAKDDEEEFDE